jgi:hypothetical protein
LGSQPTEEERLGSWFRSKTKSCAILEEKSSAEGQGNCSEGEFGDQRIWLIFQKEVIFKQREVM